MHHAVTGSHLLRAAPLAVKRSSAGVAPIERQLSRRLTLLRRAPIAGPHNEPPLLSDITEPCSLPIVNTNGVQMLPLCTRHLRGHSH
jgi:hypothetical protein